MCLESTNCFRAEFGRLASRWCSVGTTHFSTVVPEVSFIAGPTTDSESIARHLCLSLASFSSQEYTVDCTATHNTAYAVGGVGGGVTCLFQNHGDQRSSNSWNVSHLGRLSREIRDEGVQRLSSGASGAGVRHDACADPRDALKNKTARTTTRTSRQFI